jgi:hypothetical protein
VHAWCSIPIHRRPHMRFNHSHFLALARSQLATGQRSHKPVFLINQRRPMWMPVVPGRRYVHRAKVQSNRPAWTDAPPPIYRISPADLCRSRRFFAIGDRSDTYDRKVTPTLNRYIIFVVTVISPIIWYFSVFNRRMEKRRVKHWMIQLG